MLKASIYALTILLVIRSVSLDSVDLLLKEEFGLVLGSYYMHPVDICLGILALLATSINLKLLLSKETLVLLFLFMCSYVFDLFIADSHDIEYFGNITLAYFKVLIPVISSLIIVRYMLYYRSYRFISIIVFATYFFVAAQYSWFAIFPIESWIHEEINIGPITFFRSISTSGPPTAGGYVFFFLFLTYRHIKQYFGHQTLNRKFRFEDMLDSKLLMLMASLLTFTRGLSILAICAYLSDTFKNGRISWKKFIWLYFFIGSILLIFVGMIGVRTESGYALSGDLVRLEAVEKSLSNIQLSDFFLGSGFGTLYKREVHWYVLDSFSFNLRAPHNLNVLLLLEIGLFRLLILYVVLSIILFKLIKNRNKIHAFNFVATILILFNVETILVFPEYNYAWFLYIICGYYLKQDPSLSLNKELKHD